MARVRTSTANPPKKRRPGLTPESRENQMIALAMDLVEQRLLDGTASSQETTHFLKLATRDYQLKIDNLKEENKLMRAKTEQLESLKSQEELLEKAMRAFAGYSGRGDDDGPPEDQIIF